jgi:hypothetical protein
MQFQPSLGAYGRFAPVLSAEAQNKSEVLFCVQYEELEFATRFEMATEFMESYLGCVRLPRNDSLERIQLD